MDDKEADYAFGLNPPCALSFAYAGCKANVGAAGIQRPVMPTTSD
jgi:hypothetical protein